MTYYGLTLRRLLLWSALILFLIIGGAVFAQSYVEVLPKNQEYREVDYVVAPLIPSTGWRIRIENYPALKRIAVCESNLNPSAYSWDGGAQSRGLFQISRKYWPQISDEQAFDPEWSLDWAVKQSLKIWTCARILKLI